MKVNQASNMGKVYQQCDISEVVSEQLPTNQGLCIKARTASGVSHQSVTFRFRNFSVSKLFHFFWWYRYRFRKILVSKKVSVLVSKKFGIEKSIGIGFEKKLVSKKVSVSVSKNFGIEKSIGIGFEKFCSHKNYRYRFRKFLYWKRTQIFMIYSITLNLEQYEPRKVFLFKLFFVGRTEAAKEDASNWRKWWIMIMAKITLIVRGFLTNATSVNILPFGGAVWGDI